MNRKLPEKIEKLVLKHMGKKCLRRQLEKFENNAEIGTHFSPIQTGKKKKITTHSCCPG